MSDLKSLAKSLALVIFVGLLLQASSAKADEWNKETKVTFSGPVQVENTQLPAGTYVFKLADTADRHVVQIFNEDQTQVIATILAIPDYRVEPTGKTVVKFAETNDEAETSGALPGSGIPIKEWFYPGDSSGNEFRVVPQPQVAAVEPAPEAPAEAAPSPATEPPEAVAPPAEQPATPEPPTPSPQAEQTQPAPEQPAAPEQRAAPEQLPQTASQMPVVGLMGILSLAAAAALSFVSKISA